MDDIIFVGYADIAWNCACGHHNKEVNVQLDSFDGNEYKCEECGKEYVFRVDLKLEEVED